MPSAEPELDLAIEARTPDLRSRPARTERAQKASDLSPAGMAGSRLDGITTSLPPPEPASRHGLGRDVASRRTRTLLSFQGPVPVEVGREKASARARGLRSRRATRTSYPIRTKALLGRRAFPCLPLGRPTNGSRAAEAVNRGGQAPGRRRTNRRLPACTSAPPRASRGMSSSAATAPFTFTPPWAITLRQWLRL